MSKKEELESKIAKLQKELEDLDKLTLDATIKHIDTYSDATKIAKFNSMYNFALIIVKETEENGYFDDDASQYCFEEMMTLLIQDREKFWKYFNSLY